MVAQPEDRAEQRKFALRVFQELMKAGVTDAAYDADEFRITYRNGEMVANLRGVYTRTRGVSAEAADAEIHRWVAAAAAPTPPRSTWSEVRPLLRVVVRPCSYGADGSIELIRRPLLEFMDEVLVIDEPNVMTYPNTEQLATWEVTADEAFEVAWNNVTESLMVFELQEGGICSLQTENDNTYLSTWLFRPGWLATCARNFTSPPVAFIPDHTTVLIVPAEPEFLATMYEQVEELYLKADRPLTPQGFTLVDEGYVVPLDMIVDAPAPEAAARARTVLAGCEYRAQKTVLDDTMGDFFDVFVASHMVNDEGPAPVSAAVWGEGVDSLLPEADAIAFAFESQETIFVPFAQAVEITGMAPAPEFRPTRYHAQHWPDAATFERLRAVAIAPPRAGQ